MVPFVPVQPPTEQFSSGQPNISTADGSGPEYR